MLTQKRLKELLHYDPLTGVFTWLIPQRNKLCLGDAAGFVHLGYRIIKILGVQYQAHRLAWIYMTGVWPIDQIDHINGVRDDNKWTNLREATNTTNQQNQRRAHKNNALGILGVTRRYGKFRAHIKYDGLLRYLGAYQTPELAYAAYIEAKRTFHPGGTL